MKIPAKCAYCLLEWDNLSEEILEEYKNSPSMWTAFGTTQKIDPAIRALEPKYATTVVNGTKCCDKHAVAVLKRAVQG